MIPLTAISSSEPDVIRETSGSGIRLAVGYTYLIFFTVRAQTDGYLEILPTMNGNNAIGNSIRTTVPGDVPTSGRPVTGSGMMLHSIFSDEDEILEFEYTGTPDPVNPYFSAYVLAYPID